MWTLERKKETCLIKQCLFNKSQPMRKVGYERHTYDTAALTHSIRVGCGGSVVELRSSDSGARGPGFETNDRRMRQSVLGMLNQKSNQNEIIPSE